MLTNGSKLVEPSKEAQANLLPGLVVWEVVAAYMNLLWVA
jgi:hypothetical protein